MPRRYDASTKAEAIRLVRDHAGDYPAQWAGPTGLPCAIRARYRRSQCQYTSVHSADADACWANTVNRKRRGSV